MINKKAEGRSSSFFIVLIISLSLMILFSGLLSSIVNNYGVDDMDQFEKFRGNYDQMIEAMNKTMSSEEAAVIEYEDSDQWVDRIAKKSYNIASKFWTGIKNTATKAEGGFSIGVNTFQMFGDGMNIVGSNGIFGYEIPDEIKVMMYLIIGITIMVLGISVIMRYKV